jgi:hypothetical protein
VSVKYGVRESKGMCKEISQKWYRGFRRNVVSVTASHFLFLADAKPVKWLVQAEKMACKPFGAGASHLAKPKASLSGMPEESVSQVAILEDMCHLPTHQQGSSPHTAHRVTLPALKEDWGMTSLPYLRCRRRYWGFSFKSTVTGHAPLCRCRTSVAVTGHGGPCRTCR